MRKSFLITAAAAALIGTSGIALSQQSPGAGGSGAPSAPSATRTSPSAGAPAERGAPMNRGESSGGMKGGQAEMPREGSSPQRAQDNAGDDMKSKGAETTRDQKGGKAASDNNAGAKDGMKANQNASDTKSGTTTGQAGAGAKLSTEQRTTIRTSITKQNVQPVTNVNFSISVGTRVPRTVTFHPLPADVITMYPDWRGHEFFLVRSQIIVVNPRTMEIVAVLEA